MVTRPGDLEDRGPLPTVVRTDPYLVQTPTVEGLVRAVERAVGVDGDPSTVGEREHRRASQPHDRLAVLSVGRRHTVDVQPLEVVLEADEWHRLAAVGARPAPVRVDASAVGQLPVPHAEEAVRELDLEPQPQRAAPVITDAPRVVALTPPLVHFVGGAPDRVAAVVDARLEHMALVPNQLVPGTHRPAPQAVRVGASAEGEVHPERAALRVGPQVNLLERANHLDACRAD